MMRSYLFVGLMLAACEPAAPPKTPTISILGVHYPVSQLISHGDSAYFTVEFSETTSHRYFASCSRAAFSGIEWESFDPPYNLPTLAFEPSDSALFRTLCDHAPDSATPAAQVQ
jgi:hypothetical protein